MNLRQINCTPVGAKFIKVNGVSHQLMCAEQEGVVFGEKVLYGTKLTVRGQPVKHSVFVDISESGFAALDGQRAYVGRMINTGAGCEMTLILEHLVGRLFSEEG